MISKVLAHLIKNFLHLLFHISDLLAGRIIPFSLVCIRVENFINLNDSVIRFPKKVNSIFCLRRNLISIN